MARNPKRQLGCPGCGFRVTGEEDACPRCGAKFDRATLFECPFCGDRVPRDAFECPSCHVKYDEFYSKMHRRASDDNIDELLLEIIELEASQVKKEDKRLSCPNCSWLLDGTEDRCPKCGVGFISDDVSYQCPICGATVPAEAVKCAECGATFVEEEAKAAPEARAEPPPAPSATVMTREPTVDLLSRLSLPKPMVSEERPADKTREVAVRQEAPSVPIPVHPPSAPESRAPVADIPPEEIPQPAPPKKMKTRKLKKKS